MTMSAARADATLEDALDIGGTGVYVWLHTGSPGANGTANVAQTTAPANIVRKLVEFAAVGNHPTNTERRSLSNSAVEWTGAQIASGQEITHFSLWSAATGGQVEFIARGDDAEDDGLGRGEHRCR
jgi:hypothetical protein